MRSGCQYLHSLHDGRHVVIDGEVVKNVTTHPAFAGVCRTVGQLYDHIAADQKMTFRSTATGERVAVGHMIPRSQADLEKRNAGLRRIADVTYGLLGRGPEHVAGFMAGFASAPEVFSRKDSRFGDNVRRFHDKIREEHLYVAYTIVPPQIDRSKTAHQLDEPNLQASVFQERDGGIVIRGAQMLGTAAAIADYLFLSCIQPLRPGDEAYAISLVLPMNAPGLRLYARRSYAAGQSSCFDYPLSTRYDESDSLVVFRDVFVPWEQVFVYRDVELARGQFFSTPAHILGNSQAQIRLISKTQFLTGLAGKIAAVNGIDKMPPVQEQLGEMASLSAVVEGMVLASQSAAPTNANGVVHPHPRFLYGAMALQAQLYPRLIQILRELCGGGLLQVPSSMREFQNADTCDDIRRFIQSPDVKAEYRVKLFKLAWEMVGSEFAGRHQQYELFYAGAPFVVKGYAYRNYGFQEALSLVERCLASYDLDG